jgi:hypothetical protein
MMKLSKSVLLMSVLSLAAAEDDRNLQGCSVELDSYFFNLYGLSKDK